MTRRPNITDPGPHRNLWGESVSTRRRFSLGSISCLDSSFDLIVLHLFLYHYLERPVRSLVFFASKYFL